VVPQAPIPVVTEGQLIVVYELHLTNFAAEPLSVKRVRIRESGTGRELVSFAEASLAHRISLVSGKHSGHESSTEEAIPPGERAVVFIEFKTKIGAVPARLWHEIDYTGGDSSRVLTVSSPIIIVNGTAPIVLAPPFHEGIWVAVHGASWQRGHRRMMNTLAGRVRIPGRFAVDWLAVDEQGRTTHADADDPKDSIDYGVSILAGADGMVAATRDGVEESPSIRSNPKHALGLGSGNYVALNLGSGRYAFYGLANAFTRGK
jgi:murein DD-endopeptidase